jgi:hypothetical protein
MEFQKLFSQLNDNKSLQKRVDKILSLKCGDKIEILGVSEVPGQEYDDVLVIQDTPQLYDNYIIFNVVYPSGKESTEEVYLDLLEDITLL